MKEFLPKWKLRRWNIQPVYIGEEECRLNRSWIGERIPG